MKLATLSFALTTLLAATALSGCVGADTGPADEISIVRGQSRTPVDCASSPTGWSTREVYPLTQISVGTKLLNTNEVFADTDIDDDSSRKPEALVAAVLLNLEIGAHVSDEVLAATTEVDEWLVAIELGNAATTPTDATTTLRDYVDSLRPCAKAPDRTTFVTYEIVASSHPPQEPRTCTDSTAGCPTIPGE